MKRLLIVLIKLEAIYTPTHIGAKQVFSHISAHRTNALTSAAEHSNHAEPKLDKVDILRSSMKFDPLSVRIYNVEYIRILPIPCTITCPRPIATQLTSRQKGRSQRTASSEKLHWHPLFLVFFSFISPGLTGHCENTIIVPPTSPSPTATISH